MNELNEQERAIYADLLPIWHKDVGAFAEDVFGITLSSKQLEICDAFVNNRYITLRGGVGFGKTMAMSILVWWSLLTHDEVQVSIFGPNEGQLRGGIWKEIKSLYNKFEKRHPKLASAYWMNETNLRRKINDADCFAEIRLATKENDGAARGIHKRNNFIMVDEATGVDDKILSETLHGAMTDFNAKYFLVSNPSKIDCYFYKTFYDDDISQSWTKVHGRLDDNPFLTDDQIKNAERQYGGVTSSRYRYMVLGEFPLSDVDGLISREDVEAAVNADDVIPPPNVRPVWGLDPAGKGRDKSVLAIRHDNTLLDIKEWAQYDAMQLCHAVVEIHNKTPTRLQPEKIFVDATGIGDGIYHILREMGLPVVKVMMANRPTRKPERYNNMRDQVWVECRDWFVEGNVKIPNHSELIRDLCTPTYEEYPKYKVESKKNIKKRLSRSPDYADALCLTFAARRSTFGTSSLFQSKIVYDTLSQYE